MTNPSTVRQRVEEAGNLAEVLDAAYEAFETVLSVIDGYHDGGGPFFAGLLMASAAAADGRNALLEAPSLPLTSQADLSVAEPESGARSSAGVAAQAAGDPVAAAATVAALSASAASGLRRAAAWAVAAADRAACLDAARYADEVLVLTRGNGP